MTAVTTELRVEATARQITPDTWGFLDRGDLLHEDEDVQNSLEWARQINAADPLTAEFVKLGRVSEMNAETLDNESRR